MLYETYKKRIMKLVKIRDFIIKNKIWFIIGFAVLFALFCAFEAVKGNFKGRLTVSDQIVYGDGIDSSIGVVFGRAQYEYRRVGEETWSDKQPTSPGDYEVRAVSRKFLGIKNYSEPTTFSILKRGVTVSAYGGSTVYGEKPQADIDLAQGDTVAFDELEYRITQLYSLKTSYLPIIESVRITNADGVDVTSSYGMTALEKILDITPRALQVTTASGSKTYDGQPIAAESYEISSGNLINGDVLAVVGWETNSGDAGEYPNMPTRYAVTDTDGEDITEYYKIDTVAGRLVVDKRPVTIKTFGNAKIYDGYALANTAFEIVAPTALSEGESAFVSGHTEIVDAGTAANELSVIIKNENGVEKTQNYVIAYDCGTLEITKRDITVVTPDVSGVVYDGYEHYAQSVLLFECELGFNDGIEISGYTFIKDVGSVENVMTVKIINNQADKTANYNVAYRYGRIEIIQRNICLKPRDELKIYDGLPLVSGGYNVVEATGCYDLAEGDGVSFKTDKQVTDVGLITDNAFTEITFFDKNNRDVTANYDVTTRYGSLRVLPRPVTVKTASSNKVYDGTAFDCGEFEFVGEFKPVLNHQARVSSALPQITEFSSGGTANEFTVGIYDGDSNVTENYEISYEYGTLFIDKRPISIKPVDKYKVYDGTSLTCNECEIVSGSLVLEHFIEITTDRSVINVFDETDNNITSVEILERQGSSVSKAFNYDITLNAGELRILQRELWVESASSQKIYDGEDLYNGSFEITLGSLADGENSVVKSGSYAVVNDVCSVDNVLEIQVYKGDFETTLNYDINYVYGNLTVTVRSVTIAPKGDTKVYDGLKLTCDDYDDIGELKILSAHTVAIIAQAEITEVGSVLNWLEVAILEGSTNKTHNYSIGYENTQELIVTKRLISVKPQDEEKVYDGLPLEGSTAEIVSGSLVLDHYILLRTDGSVTDANESDYLDNNNITFAEIVDSSGLDKSTNYEITLLSGSLKVTLRPVTIAPQEVTEYYSDEAITPTRAIVTEGSLVLDHFISARFNGSQTDVGESYSSIASFEILSGSVIKTGNYSVTLQQSVITVLKRPVTVLTGSSQKIYDGEKLSDDTFEIIGGSGLAAGHELVVTGVTEVYDAGIYENVLTVDVLRDGLIKTANYEITMQYGSLTIERRAATISTFSDGKIYDGEALYNKGFTPFNLVDGHAARVTSLTNITTYAEGGVPNVLVVEIYDGAENNVTTNYDLEYIYGTLTIYKRSIIVSTDSAVKIYDGQPLSCERFVVTKGTDVVDDKPAVVGSDNAVVRERSELTLVGAVENVLQVAVYQGYLDYTSNYEISYEYGTLEVKKRTVLIKPKDMIKTYDGIALTAYECVVLQTSPYGFAEGDSAVVESTKSIINVGKITDNEIADIVVTNTDLTDRTACYEFVTSYGALTVIKRYVVIKPQDMEKVYDGMPLVSDTAEVVSGTIVEGDTITIETDKTLTDVGKIYDNQITSFNVKNILGEDITSNYNVSVEYGSLSVLKRTIIVATGSLEDYYTGNEYFCEDYSLTDGTLVLDHVLVVTDYTKAVEAGKYSNELRFDILDGENSSVLTNYDLKQTYGTLNIKKRPITVLSPTFDTVYDGELKSDSALYAEPSVGDLDYALVSGHKFVVTKEYEARFSGEYKNQTEFTICDENEIDKKANYEITFIAGTITINKRTVQVKTQSGSVVYDGENHSFEGYEFLKPADAVYEGSALAATDVITIAKKTILNDVIFAEDGQVTSVDNVLELAVYNGETLATESYELIYEYGAVQVDLRQITVKTDSVGKIYDGTVLSCGSFAITSELSLCSGHTVAVKDLTEIVNVGSVENVFTIEIYADAKDVTANYEITAEYGALTIEARPVYCSTLPTTKEYDGTKQAPDVEFLTEGSYSGYFPLAEGHYYKVLSCSSTMLTEISSKRLYVKSIGIFDALNNDVTSNYTIKYSTTRQYLTVTARKITVRPVDKTKVYDGTALESSEIEITQGSILEGHTVVAVTDGSVTTVSQGEVENGVTGVTVYDKNGNDVTTKYYEVTVESGKLSVIKRDLSVTLGTEIFEYDGFEHFVESYAIDQGYRLVEGHEIRLSDITTKSEVGEYESTATVRIFFGEEDVTENYNVICNPGLLIISKLEITVETATDTKVYDGLPLINLNVEVVKGYLLSSHRITATASEGYIDCGAYENVLDIVILDGSDNDVTSYYEITYVYGYLTITQREITVLTSTDSKYYDNLPLSNAEGFAIIEGSLATGDSLIAKAGYSAITDVGAIDNVVGYSVSNGVKDVTANYVIAMDYGTLEVLPCPVTLIPVSTTAVYDGLSKTVTECTVRDGLPEGFTVAVVASDSIVDVGSIEVFLTDAIITDASGVDKTANFVVTFEGSATVTVTPRPIVIKPTAAIKVYDGTALTSDSATDVDGKLLVGHKIVITTDGSITNVGTTTNNITYYRIYDGETNVTQNYEVTTQSGVLTVTVRPITIRITDAEKVYDGTVLTSDEYEIVISETGLGLPVNHLITLECDGEQLTAGSSANGLKSVVITFGEDDVTSNFEISCIQGTLTVKAAAITVDVESVSKVYDGLSVSSKNYTVVNAEALPENSSLLLDETSVLEFTEAGIYDNLLKFKVYDGSDNDISGNYEIEIINGKIIIDKADLVVETGSASKLYDGTKLVCDEFGLIEGNLAEGQTLQLVEEFSIINVARVENIPTFGVFAGDEDKSGNYNIIILSGYLEITHRQITVMPEESSVIYNGEYVVTLKGELAADSLYELAEGHSISLGIVQGPKDVGVYEIYVESVTVTDASGEDVTANYIIETENGRLEIIKRSLTIKPKDMIKVYDGEALVCVIGETAPGSPNTLVKGHTVSVISDKTITTVGSVTDNTITGYVIYDENGAVVTRNYSVETEQGSLTVTKRKLVVKPVDLSKEYDGLPLKPSSYELLESSSLAAGHTLSATLSGEQTEPGRSASYFEADTAKIVDSYGNDVTFCYEIDAREGVLTVVLRKITLTPLDCSVTYNGGLITARNTWFKLGGELYPGHTVSVVIAGSGVNVGGYLLSIESYVIYDENGQDITGMYEVTTENGLLSITTRKITVKSETIETVLDDGVDGGTVLVSSKNESCWISKGSLSSGEIIEFSDRENYITKDMYDAGTHSIKNTIDVSSIQIYYYDSYGNKVYTTSNYTITKVEGDLVVNES